MFINGRRKQTLSENKFSTVIQIFLSVGTGCPVCWFRHIAKGGIKIRFYWRKWVNFLLAAIMGHRLVIETVSHKGRVLKINYYFRDDVHYEGSNSVGF